MEQFLLIGILFLVFTGIPLGTGWFIFWAIKTSGHPRAAKLVASLFGFIIFVFSVSIYYEDELFSKNSASSYIEQQGIKLKDEFKILHNESMSGIGDYYHTFTLEISELDKINAISNIKKSDNYNTHHSYIEEINRMSDSSRYFGSIVFRNYQTEFSFVREYFEPSGQKGYAPIFRRISISKSKNELTFEDIDE